MIPDGNIIGPFTDQPLQNVTPYGSGHIHRTYLVSLPEKKLILQQVNTRVFRDPGKVMENILAVTRHLKERSIATLEVVMTLAGNPLYVDRSGEFWRCYEFLEGYQTFDSVPNSSFAFEGGKAIGTFLKGLQDMQAGTLYEVIPGFHDLQLRLAAFQRAMEQDPAGRKKNVTPEIRQISERADDMLLLSWLIRDGVIPIRVAHNDTKVNNVLFDSAGKAFCMIDLDTVMPGTALFDFGDTVRTFANTTPEDEQDISLVFFDRTIFQALLEGFLSSCSGILNEVEKRFLPFSAKYMTYIMALRFLTDHLAGDIYYPVSYDGHNLIRARNQLQMLKELEGSFI